MQTNHTYTHAHIYARTYVPPSEHDERDVEGQEEQTLDLQFLPVVPVDINVHSAAVHIAVITITAVVIIVTVAIGVGTVEIGGVITNTVGAIIVAMETIVSTTITVGVTVTVTDVISVYSTTTIHARIGIASETLTSISHSPSLSSSHTYTCTTP